MYTKYSYLTDEEFIRMVENVDYRSPIINELINRFKEVAIDERPIDRILANSRTMHECPECEVLLDITMDDGGDLFYFGLKKA